MTGESLVGIRRKALANLIPPPKQKLSDWLECNVILPEGVSALPGAIRLYPFQREIANVIGDPAVERVTLVKPVRVGLSSDTAPGSLSDCSSGYQVDARKRSTAWTMRLLQGRLSMRIGLHEKSSCEIQTHSLNARGGRERYPQAGWIDDRLARHIGELFDQKIRLMAGILIRKCYERRHANRPRSGCKEGAIPRVRR